MNTSSDFRSDLFRLIRASGILILAALAACAVFFAAMWEVRHYRDVRENGLIEFVQFALLTLSSATFAIRSARDEAARKPLALLSLIALAMCVRELDGVFDTVLFHGSWALLDTFVLLAYLAVFFSDVRRTVSQLADFVFSPTFVLFAAGFILAVVVSRLFGMKQNWYAFFDFVPGDGTEPVNPITGTTVPRCVKNAAEECFELASYLVILAAAVLPPLLRGRRCGSGGDVV